MARLDNPKIRYRFLEIVRTTGVIGDGIKLAGLNAQTLSRYRNAHPEFDQAIHDAVQYYFVQRELEYGQETRRQALDYFNFLLKTQQLKHEVLYKYLFERDKRTPIT